MDYPHVPLPANLDLPDYSRPEQVDICYRAACDGDLDVVKEQVRQLLHDPSLGLTSSTGEAPHPAWLYGSLCEAIRQENLDMIQFLLDENVSNSNLLVENAVRSRAFKVLELLLRRYGCDINQPLLRNEPSVLSIPLSTGDEEMVVWLLDHGADPNSRCNWDFTPTSYAVYLAPLKTIDYLFQRGANPFCGQLLQHAVIRDKGALDVVRLLVEKGAPINEIKYEKDPKTYYERELFGLGTPLHRAAEFGKLDIVKYLLEMGADALKLDSRGRTSRFWAGKNSHTEVVRVLEEAENLQRKQISTSVL